MSDAVRAAPTLEMPKKPSFMVLDGKTYFVDSMELSPTDMLHLVEGYYKDNLEALKSKVFSHITEETLRDLDAQVRRVERHLSGGVVAVPENLRGNGTILCLSNNRIYETRVVLFKPTRMTFTMQRVRDHVVALQRNLPKKEQERYSRFIEWANPMIDHLEHLKRDLSAIKVDIVVNQDIIMAALVVSFIREEGIIRVTPEGVHPHVHGGGRLCTGNATSEVFWNDPQFVANFNSLNPHSWASSGTVGAQKHSELLRNTYFVSAAVREPEGGGSWRIL